MRRNTVMIAGVLLSLPIILGNTQGDGCSQQQRDMREVQEKVMDRKSYIMKNEVEFKNYDRRQKLADDSTAILWCTSAFPIPSSPLFTFPVVGKLTSGGKKPFPTNENQPGPDGMYGHGGEYRYGFTPGNIYVDYYNMPTFCTSEPTIWQRQTTTIAMANDPELMRAHEAARKALREGKPEEATRILETAVNQLKR